MKETHTDEDLGLPEGAVAAMDAAAWPEGPFLLQWNSDLIRWDPTTWELPVIYPMTAQEYAECYRLFSNGGRTCP